MFKAINLNVLPQLDFSMDSPAGFRWRCRAVGTSEASPQDHHHLAGHLRGITLGAGWVGIVVPLLMEHICGVQLKYQPPWGVQLNWFSICLISSSRPPAIEGKRPNAMHPRWKPERQAAWKGIGWKRREVAPKSGKEEEKEEAKTEP